jgi:ABC-type branched-subunit amino acid transport system substrate-binding protein
MHGRMHGSNNIFTPNSEPLYFINIIFKEGKMKRTLMILLVLVLVISLVGCQSSAPTPTEEPAATTTPIKVGHLSYHTGPFGHLGPMFDGAAAFALGFVNENPPLGRSVELINQDIGTLGEGQIARKLVESEKVNVLLNVAGEYMSYRDWLLQVEADNNGPLLPSVHGGAIAAEYGGTAAEPIFRGAPMDTDQGLAAAIYLQKAGAKSVVVMAVENDGMQMQQEAAAKACETLGMTVLKQIDMQPEQTSYRSEVSQAMALKPDAMIIYGAAEDGGTLVKNASEMGMSTMIVGEVNFLFDEFLNTATLDAIQKQKFVKAVGFAYAEGPAWDFYKKAWDSSEYASLADASNPYVLQFYDVLNVTMLAIEKAGSTDADAWTKAMYEVSMGPGKKVYTYAEGIAALKNGEAIDYDGVTGTCDYTQNGVVGGLFEIFDWSTGTLTHDSYIEGKEVLDLSVKMMAK